MAWTTPATWVANATLTAAQLNTQVRDNLDFLYDNGRVRAETSDQSISDITWTPITWGAETYDTSSGMHSTGTLTNRFIAVADGLHYMTVTVAFAASATGERAARISDNVGTTLAQVQSTNAGGSLLWIATLSWVDYLDNTDWLQVEVWQNTGGNLSTSASAPMRCTFGQLRG